MASEKPIIRDNISDFSDEDKENDVHESVEPSNQKNKRYKYVVKCNQYDNGCCWRARASFNKIRRRWEMKKINGIKTCTTSLISQDHVRLDSSVIAHNIVHLVKKILKALEIAFGSWEESHSYLSVWMTVAQHFVPSTIVRYKTTTSMEDESSKVILNCVFWVFKPCIEGFQYCKSIVQMVVETFFHLLLQFLRARAKKLECDKGTSLLAALRLERVGWTGPDVSSVYCILLIALNFNKQFKNVDSKEQVINMGYEMSKPRFEAKLLAMRSEFP
ncbi:hypothetical protein HKD37_18G050800 [Glycine soja]